MSTEFREIQKCIEQLLEVAGPRGLQLETIIIRVKEQIKNVTDLEISSAISIMQFNGAICSQQYSSTFNRYTLPVEADHDC